MASRRTEPGGWRRRGPGAVLGLLAPVLIGLAACGADSIEPARTFYVDYDHGSDRADGVSAATPWRHAPGDPQAEGGPAHAGLHPGDVVLFRGGVIYRGTVKFPASGEAGRPITYRGEGFGPGRAIMSGRDAYTATAQPCAGAEICAGLANAANLRIVDLPGPAAPSDQLVLDGRLLELAQSPQVPDAFWYDSLASYQPAPQDAFTDQGGSWRLRSGYLKKVLGAQPVRDLTIHLWGTPNAITSAPVQAYDPAAGALTVAAPDFKPYPDRDSLFALVNHPALIRKPGQFATVDGGRRIVVQAAPTGASTLEISRRGVAFDVAGKNHLVVEGFEITGYAAGPKGWGQGAALVSMSKGAQDITFRNNQVHDLTSWAGVGAVHAVGVTGLTVADNSFTRMWRGGGVIVGVKSADVRVVRNRFDHIGRVGVAILGAERVLIDHNVLSGLYGHHGNGMAVYLDNRDVVVSNNLIRDATRTLTFQGGPEAQGLIIRNNILLADGPDGSAIQSWGSAGGPSRRVVIEGNVALVENGRYAMRLNGHDEGLVVRRNLIDGLLISGQAADWSVRDNIYTAENYTAANGSAQAYDAANRFDPGRRQAAAALARADRLPDAAVCRLLSLEPDAAALARGWADAEGPQAKSPGLGPRDFCKP